MWSKRSHHRPGRSVYDSDDTTAPTTSPLGTETVRSFLPRTANKSRTHFTFSRSTVSCSCCSATRRSSRYTNLCSRAVVSAWEEELWRAFLALGSSGTGGVCVCTELQHRNTCSSSDESRELLCWGWGGFTGVMDTSRFKATMLSPATGWMALRGDAMVGTCDVFWCKKVSAEIERTLVGTIWSCGSCDAGGRERSPDRSTTSSAFNAASSYGLNGVERFPWRRSATMLFHLRRTSSSLLLSRCETSSQATRFEVPSTEPSSTEARPEISSTSWSISLAVHCGSAELDEGCGGLTLLLFGCESVERLGVVLSRAKPPRLGSICAQRPTCRQNHGPPVCPFTLSNRTTTASRLASERGLQRVLLKSACCEHTGEIARVHSVETPRYSIKMRRVHTRLK